MLRNGDGKYRVVVRSPATGFVIQKMVQQGATVTPGQMLFEVADLVQGLDRSGYLRARPEHDSNGPRDRCYRRSLSKPRVHRHGQFDLSRADPVTRTNRVRFDVDNSERKLRAGMYANVTLSTPVQQTEPFQTMLVSTRTAPENAAAAIAKQAVCPVTGAKLGSMGDPVAVQADGQTVVSMLCWLRKRSCQGTGKICVTHSHGFRRCRVCRFLKQR